MSRSPTSVAQIPPAATTIVLTGGGSGGHITPLLPLARALKDKEPSCQIIYIGLAGDRLKALQNGYKIFDPSGIEFDLSNSSVFDGIPQGQSRGTPPVADGKAGSTGIDKVFYVKSGKFRRYHGQSLLAHVVDIKSPILNLRDLFRVVSGTLSSRRLLKRLKPDVVFSKGGYVVVPVGLAAKLLHIPIVTHDSDATAGMANRIVGRWAKVHATGLPASYYNYPKNTIAHVGIPIAKDIKPIDEATQSQLKKELGIPETSLVLLICGGGLGSRRVNDLTVEIAPQLLAQSLELYLIQITGKLHEEAVKNQYKTMLDGFDLKRVKVLSFSDQFSKISGAADLVIARAGATTLAELQLQQKACVIIPAPFLAGGHQLKNAEILKQAGAAIVVSEDIKPQELLKLILDLLKDTAKRRQLAKKMATLAHPRAAEELAEIILNVAHRRRV